MIILLIAHILLSAYAIYLLNKTMVSNLFYMISSLIPLVNIGIVVVLNILEEVQLEEKKLKERLQKELESIKNESYILSILTETPTGINTFNSVKFYASIESERLLTAKEKLKNIIDISHKQGYFDITKEDGEPVLVPINKVYSITIKKTE